ncbi:methyl-accepting chemotaxis protein [Phenylobacterium sp.]|uniref:methyl-accepting chemotaxis protein n=1 Tax=Phenylobacterium sp. TaxID=1871053 RepID=UPI003BAB50C5
MRLRISRAIGLIGALVFAAMLASVGASFYAIQQLRVGGPLYERIILGKDLVADILPPPEYVIEAYLEARLAIDNPAGVAQSKARLKQLHKDYDDRHAYWLAARLPVNLKREMVETSHAQVQRFWRQVEDDYIPALERGDKTGAQASLDEIAGSYAAHRLVVDRMVVASNAMNAAVEGQAARQRTVLLTLASSLALFAAAALAAGLWAIRAGLVGPLVRMTRVMSRLAAGEHDQETPFKARGDEVGEMARAVEVFRAAATEREALEARGIQERARADQARDQNAAEREAASLSREGVMVALAGGLERLALGDLDCRLPEEFPSEYEALRGNFNTAILELAQTLGVIAGATTQVRTSAASISQAADDLSQRTDQQASSLEETAAALEQITATVRQTAEGAEQTRQVVAEANEVAERSGAIVGEAVGAMERIERSSREIAQIVGVIDEIAFQTNLLALNAGVEAARAGDSGKGFAVVAQEVRGLAQRSAEAAKEIKGLIAISTGEVETGVGLVNSAGEALSAITGKVAQINDLALEMAASIREQATGLAQVNLAVTEMDRTTHHNATMVEETTRASHALAGQAEALNGMVARFGAGHPPASAVQRAA